MAHKNYLAYQNAKTKYIDNCVESVDLKEL